MATSNAPEKIFDHMPVKNPVFPSWSCSEPKKRMGEPQRRQFMLFPPPTGLTDFSVNPAFFSMRNLP